MTTRDTPVDALARAYRAAPVDQGADAAATAMHEHLTERGWELDQRPTDNTIRFTLDPTDIPHVDNLVSAADALAHSLVTTTEIPGVRFGTDEFWALMADNLQSLNWHVIHTGSGEILHVVNADQGFATFPRGDRAVILPNSSTGPELAALSAMVDMFDGHDPGTQARMARYLADRYAGGPPEAQ